MVALFGIFLETVISKLSFFDVVSQAFEDFSMTDMYFEMHRGDNLEYNDDIVIVDMTDVSSRDTLAQAIVDIQTCQPKVLVVDLIFANPNFDPMDDVMLVSSLSGANGQLLSCKLTDYSPQQGNFRSCLRSFFAASGHYDWAYSNVLQKKAGGCIREMTLSQRLNADTVWSLPYLAACRYRDRQPVREPLNVRKIMYDDTDFPVVPCRQVLQHADLLKGKIVIFGTTTEEADMHITPIGKMPGTKVLAYSMLTCLDHGHVREMSTAGCLLLAFLLCYVAAWLDYKIDEKFPLWSDPLTKAFNFLLAALVVWWGFSRFISSDYYVNLLYPLVAFAVVDDIRQLYEALIVWLQQKTRWEWLKKSLYAENE